MAIPRVAIRYHIPKNIFFLAKPAIDDVREYIIHFVDVQVVSYLMRFTYIFWIIAGLVLDNSLVKYPIDNCRGGIC